jgi:hypothetical protein
LVGLAISLFNQLKKPTLLACKGNERFFKLLATSASIWFSLVHVGAIGYSIVAAYFSLYCLMLIFFICVCVAIISIAIKFVRADSTSDCVLADFKSKTRNSTDKTDYQVKIFDCPLFKHCERRKTICQQDKDFKDDDISFFTKAYIIAIENAQNFSVDEIFDFTFLIANKIFLHNATALYKVVNYLKVEIEDKNEPLNESLTRLIAGQAALLLCYHLAINSEAGIDFKKLGASIDISKAIQVIKEFADKIIATNTIGNLTKENLCDFNDMILTLGAIPYKRFTNIVNNFKTYPLHSVLECIKNKIMSMPAQFTLTQFNKKQVSNIIDALSKNG